MAIISRIGRKYWKTRLLYIAMYAFLVTGGATMVYPFLLMISGSTKSAVDIKYFDAVPRFLYDDTWLYRKHMEGLFNESVSALNFAYGTDCVSFERIEPPEHVNEALAREFREFLNVADLPGFASTFGYLHTPVSRTIPHHLRGFKKELQRRYGGDIDAVNKALAVEFIDWNSVALQAERYLMRRDKPTDSLFQREVDAYKAIVPLGQRYVFSPEGYFKREFIKVTYSTDIATYNEKHGTDYAAYDQVRLSQVYPADKTEKERNDWEEFVRDTLAIHWIRADASATSVYRGFLKTKYGRIDALNRDYGTDYASFDDVPLIDEPSMGGSALTDWESVLAGWRDPDTDTIHELPVTSLRVHGPDFMFRDYLQEKFGTLDAVNEKLGTSIADFAEIGMPQRDLHYLYFQQNKGMLRREFATRNYRTVAEYMLFHGRGIFNTVVYCALQVMIALLINPLAAYAMSRFKMPSSYKILLFLLCTMAFPPMVTSIPNFLMLRKLGLLNTFFALILPGMANGYSIFLLKGFFDAQPQELYESAQIDGASEWVLFWHIAMSLSKPILAVIALTAFTGAYTNFMFAFVVCQDEKMWTLMVWLYQLQQRSGQAVMYASLIIAAIPTFLIFLFCQNLIMRGIVVPSEK